MHIREVLTCVRCRESKRRCDKTRPACLRCRRAGVSCTYQTHRESIDAPGNVDGTVPLDVSLEQDSSSNNSREVSPFVAPGLAKRHAADRPKEQQPVKRRNRACLSCTRCHQMKIKCDKGEPCGRCLSSGRQTTCIYMHKPQATSVTPDDPVTLAGENLEGVLETWVLRHRGTSNWQALLAKTDSLDRLRILSVMKAAFGDQERAGNRYTRGFALPGNYPIGSPEAATYSSMGSILALIERSRSTYQDCIEGYMNMYHPVYPIIDVEHFTSQVSAFWTSPSEANFTWLSLFLTVLGLGTFATTRSQVQSLSLFYAAEACLMKTPFMFRPTILSVRTLVLMAVAKQAVNATCWALDSCWNVMGIIVRLAVMLRLHQGGRPDLREPDRRCIRHLWTMIVYLELQLSLNTGEPSIIPSEGLLPSKGTVSADATVTKDQIWDSVLPESFPIISHFLWRVNSNNEVISYEDVLKYDSEIRLRLNYIVSNENDGVRGIALDIFYRRVLSCLHRNLALHPDAPTLYPTSYWSSLECALALLLHYLELNDPSGLPRNSDLMVRPFMLDFSSASLTVCLHLSRTDAPLAESECSTGIPPRQTIIDTVGSCLDILSKQREYSLCYRSGYRLLKAVYNAIP